MPATGPFCGIGSEPGLDSSRNNYCDVSIFVTPASETLVHDIPTTQVETEPETVEVVCVPDDSPKKEQDNPKVGLQVTLSTHQGGG